MYDYVRLCMTMYDYVWLCKTMCDYVWLCIPFDPVWPLWPRLTPFGPVCPHLVLYWLIQKCGRSKKMNTTQKSTQKLKTAQKWRPTFTATAHATFSLDYPSMNDLRPAMMLIVETGKSNPHVKNINCGKAQKSKTTFGMQRQPM